MTTTINDPGGAVIKPITKEWYMKCLNSLLAIMTVLVVLACSEDKTSDVQLNVSTTELYYNIEGGEQVLIVTSDGDWTISNIPDWIRLSAVSGVGSKDVKVTAVPNETGVLRRGEFVIRTSDNNRIITIKVSQSAGSAYNDYGLEVDNTGEIVLGGAALSSDSVRIESKVGWVLEGPEWLMATWKAVYAHIDGKTEYSGSGVLIISATENNDAEDRSGTLTIRSTADGKTINIPVVQLGVWNVRPVHFTTMANSFSFYWKFGKAVKYVFYQPFEQAASANDKTIPASLKYTGFFEADPSIISTSNNRKPNTTYEICALGVDADAIPAREVSSVKITTATDEKQPIATVSPVASDEPGVVKYSVVLNDYAVGYYVFYDTSGKWATYADSFLAMNMRRSMTKNPDKVKYRTSNGTWSLNAGNSSVHVVTWAVDALGNFSTVLSRLTLNEDKDDSWSRFTITSGN